MAAFPPPTARRASSSEEAGSTAPGADALRPSASSRSLRSNKRVLPVMSAASKFLRGAQQSSGRRIGDAAPAVHAVAHELMFGDIVSISTVEGSGAGGGLIIGEGMYNSSVGLLHPDDDDGNFFTNANSAAAAAEGVVDDDLDGAAASTRDSASPASSQDQEAKDFSGDLDADTTAAGDDEAGDNFESTIVDPNDRLTPSRMNIQFRICPQLRYEMQRSFESLGRRSVYSQAQQDYLRARSLKEENENKALLQRYISANAISASSDRRNPQSSGPRARRAKAGSANGPSNDPAAAAAATTKLSSRRRFLRYGQIVQLQHVKSGKFLSMAPKKVAKIRKDCLVVDLLTQGSELSWFQILPRFKVRAEGAQVFAGDQIFLRSVKHADYYLNSTPETIPRPLHTVGCLGLSEERAVREVNLSVQSASWRMHLAARGSNPDAPTHIYDSQAIYLFHPEIEALLGAPYDFAARNAMWYSAERDAPIKPDQSIWVVEHAASVLEWQQATSSNPAAAAAAAARPPKGRRSSILATMRNFSFNGSSSSIGQGSTGDASERSAQTSAAAIAARSGHLAQSVGAISWNSRVALRHLATGRYLSVKPSTLDADRLEDQGTIDLELTSSFRGMLSSFHLTPGLSKPRAGGSDASGLDDGSDSDSDIHDIGRSSERAQTAIRIDDMTCFLAFEPPTPILFGDGTSARKFYLHAPPDGSVCLSILRHDQDALIGIPAPIDTVRAVETIKSWTRVSMDYVTLLRSRMVHATSEQVPDDVETASAPELRHPAAAEPAGPAVLQRGSHAASTRSFAKSQAKETYITRAETTPMIEILRELLSYCRGTSDSWGGSDALALVLGETSDIDDEQVRAELVDYELSVASRVFQEPLPPSKLALQVRLASLRLFEVLFHVCMAPEAVLADGWTDKLTSTPFRWAYFIHRLCFRAVTAIFQNSRELELALADTQLPRPARAFCDFLYAYRAEVVFEPVLMSLARQLSCGVGAVTLLRKLVNNNETLLDSKFRAPQVAFLVGLIRRHGPRKRYVELLASLCTCKDLAEGTSKCIVSNQELIVLEIFRNHPEQVLIEVAYQLDEEVEDASGAKIEAADKGSGEESFAALQAQVLGGQQLLTQGEDGSPKCRSGRVLVSWHEALSRDSAEDLGCPVVLVDAGKTWVDLERLQAIEDERATQLCSYLHGQLVLVTKLAEGRSYNCIEILEAVYTYELLVLGASNEHLHPSLRAAFCELLGALYLDRYPHVVRDLPRKIYFRSQVSAPGPYGRYREMPHCLNLYTARVDRPEGRGLGAAADASADLALPRNLEISHVLSGDDSPFFLISGPNKFLLPRKLVLDALRKYVAFVAANQKRERTASRDSGASHSDSEKGIAGGDASVSVSDQSRAEHHDFNPPPRGQERAPKQADRGSQERSSLEAQQRQLGGSGYHNASRTVDTSSARRSSTRQQDAMSISRNDGRASFASRLISLGETLILMGYSSSPAQVIDLCRASVRLLKFSSNDPLQRHEMVLRQRVCELLITASRFETDHSVSLVLHAFEDAAPDTRMCDLVTRVEGGFARAGASKESKWNLFDLQKQFTPSDLGSTVDMLLVDMVIHCGQQVDPSVQLFERALDLLVIEHSPGSRLMQGVNDTLVVSASAGARLYNAIKTRSLVLLNDFQSYGIWGVNNVFSDIGWAVVQRVKSSLRFLTRACREHRAIVESLDVPEVVLHALKINAERTPRLRVIQRLALRFFVTFAEDNTDNQHFVFEHVSLIQDLLEANLKPAVACLSAMVRGNRKICSEFPLRIIRRLVDQTKLSEDVLTLFVHLCAVNGVGIRRNQDALMQALLSDPVSETRIEALVESFSVRSKDGNSVLLAELFSAVTRGRNPYCEAKVQALCPLDSVLDLVTHPEVASMNNSFRCVLLRVLSDAFLDTGLADAGTMQQVPRVVTLLQIILSELGAFLQRCRAGDVVTDTLSNYRALVFHGFLYTLRSFFHSGFEFQTAPAAVLAVRAPLLAVAQELTALAETPGEQHLARRAKSGLLKSISAHRRARRTEEERRLAAKANKERRQLDRERRKMERLERRLFRSQERKRGRPTHENWHVFLRFLKASPHIQELIRDEQRSMIQSIWDACGNLETLSLFLRSLMGFVRGSCREHNIRHNDVNEPLARRSDQTAQQVLTIVQFTLEYIADLDVAWRAKDASKEELQRNAQGRLAEMGAVDMSFQTLCIQTSPDLARKAILSLIALLEGGNRQVQSRLYELLMSPRGERFFARLSNVFARIGEAARSEIKLDKKRRMQEEALLTRDDGDTASVLSGSSSIVADSIGATSFGTSSSKASSTTSSSETDDDDDDDEDEDAGIGGVGDDDDDDNDDDNDDSDDAVDHDDADTAAQKHGEGENRADGDLASPPSAAKEDSRDESLEHASDDDDDSASQGSAPGSGAPLSSMDVASLFELQAPRNRHSLRRKRTQAEVEQKQAAQDIVKVVRFLQLCMEGHFLEMQNLLREQGEATVYRTSTNILLLGVEHACLLTKSEEVLACSREGTVQQLIKIFDFLIESMQGPCHANQELLSNPIHRVLETVKKVLLANFTLSDAFLHERDMDKITEDDERDALLILELKAKAMRTLCAMLEGRQDFRVEDALMREIELSLVRARLVEVHRAVEVLTARGQAEETLVHLHEAATDAMTIMATLTDVQRVKGIHNIDVIKGDEEAALAYFFDKIRSVEVLFRGSVHRCFYPKPKALSFLSHSARVRLMQDINVEDPDLRLREFLESANSLLDEVSQVQQLSETLPIQKLLMDLDKIRAAAFALSVWSNFLLLFSFSVADEDRQSAATCTMREGVPGATMILPAFWDSLVAGPGPALALRIVQLLTVVQMAHLVLLRGLDLLTQIPIRLKKIERKLRLARTAALRRAPPAGATEATGSQTADNGIGAAAGARGRGGAGSVGASSTKQALTDEAFMVTALAQPFNSREARMAWSLGVGCSVASFLLVVRFGWAVLANERYLSCAQFWALAQVTLLVRTIRRAGGAIGLSASFAKWYCCLFDVMTTSRSLFQLLSLVACWKGLGLGKDAVYLVVPMFDIVLSNETLQNVVQAVRVPFRSLAMTFILLSITLYGFSLVAFLSFRDHFEDETTGENPCENLLTCFIFILDIGLRVGEGPAALMIKVPADHDMALERLAFDLGFVIIVSIFLLNAVFGVLVDQFSSLREDLQNRQAQLNNSCFICGLGRADFDAVSFEYKQRQDELARYAGREGLRTEFKGGFVYHISQEHNIYDYLGFILYLEAKDPTECNGLESFVLEELDKSSGDAISWIPSGRALSLGAHSAQENTTRAAVDRLVSTLSRSMRAVFRRLDHLETKLEVVQELNLEPNSAVEP